MRGPPAITSPGVKSACPKNAAAARLAPRWKMWKHTGLATMTYTDPISIICNGRTQNSKKGQGRIIRDMQQAEGRGYGSRWRQCAFKSKPGTGDGRMYGFKRECEIADVEVGAIYSASLPCARHTCRPGDPQTAGPTSGPATCHTHSRPHVVRRHRASVARPRECQYSNFRVSSV